MKVGLIWVEQSGTRRQPGQRPVTEGLQAGYVLPDLTPANNRDGRIEKAC